MIRATIIITRKDKGAAFDDWIVIAQSSESSEVYSVSYTTPELRTAKTFSATYNSVLQYVEDILTSLKYDTEPFEYVQVYTAIHPSVMYHLADVDDCDARRVILNQIRDAMRFTIHSC